MTRRILYLAPQPYFRLRGICLAHRTSLRALAGTGARVDILVLPGGESPSEPPGVEVLRVPRLPFARDVPIGPSWTKAAYAPLMALAALRLLATRRYDAVHACEDAALWAALLKTLFGFRFVYDMDDVLSLRLERSGFMRSRPALALARWLERHALRAADAVLVNSADTRAYASAYAAPGRVHFYDHAPDHLESAPTEPEPAPEPGLVVYAGNLEAYQGVDLLVEAWPAVAAIRPDARLEIIGGRVEQARRLEQRALRLGVSKSLRLTGPRPFAETFNRLRAAGALVSPMTQEKAVPMKLYAYMASGTPVVATAVGSHAPLLDADCAILTRPEPAALAEGILTALSDRVRGRRLAQRARERVERRLDAGAVRAALAAAHGLERDVFDAPVAHAQHAAV